MHRLLIATLWVVNSPSLLVNAIRFPSFLLFLFGKEFAELHRQNLSQRVDPLPFVPALSLWQGVRPTPPTSSLKRDLSQRVVPSLRSAHTQSDRTVLVPACPNSILRLS